MTEMFTIYGAQTVVPNFYNSFRFAEIPIGIGNFSTYMQLQTALLSWPAGGTLR